MTFGRAITDKAEQKESHAKIILVPVMPDLIRHPETQGLETALDSPSTLLRVVSLSNHLLFGAWDLEFLIGVGCIRAIYYRWSIIILKL